MHRIRLLMLLLTAFALIAGGCSETADDEASEPRTITSSPWPSTTSSLASADHEHDEDEDDEDEDGEDEPVFTEEDLYDVTTAVFSDPSTVDHRYFPLVPGTRHVYEGTALDDDELIDRKVISIVTDLTKAINGVEAVVVWERDFDDDVMIESEIAFFAQDDDGNVWHLGQYRETYDEDEFVGGRVWLVDLPAGARAGIVMHADPQPGPSYSQGWAPAPFNWTDRAAVAETGAETCVDDDTCFDDVMITEESDDEHPAAAQLKYYAPGVGNIRVGFRGPDPEEEEMVLVEDVVLDADELAEVRAEALALEERANMYSLTSPSEPRG